MIRILRSLGVILSLLLLAACNNGSSDGPSTAPTNFVAAAGEGQITLTWDTVPGQTYWLFYKAGASTSSGDAGAKIIPNVTSPYVLTGLTNGTQYAFVLNATNDGSKAGPSTPSISTSARLVGPTATWTVGTALTTNTLTSVAYGNSNFVAVGAAGTVYAAPYSYTSTGGVTAWTKPTGLPASLSSNLTSVIYDGTRFDAIGADGSTLVSTDTVTWTAATAATGGTNALAYGNGVYVAVGNGGSIQSNATAALAGAWTAQLSHTTNNLYGVAYVNNKFVAVGASGTVLTSTDGVTWTSWASGTTNNLRQVAFGLSTYVIVGDAGTVISSPDASTWTVQTSPTTQNLYAVCFGLDNQFIAVGTAGTVAYSTTGATGSWAVANAGTTDLFSIAPAGVFIAVGTAGANVSAK
ncbi:fibronectin type III domain-containing protein [Andreprevotia chitinilytica]|uniref:fibronectin type III domain-containing protein n=1 Tax=Andreprevotia chitinilytica TaxID=396808 RepID=UPI001470256F|nr:fibronectin type III domain-containing protein [Andreprevotia chitinilytica]